MTKEEFFKSIEDIKSDKLLITDSINIIDNEIAENCWSISISKEIADEFTVNDLKAFFKEIKNNRKEQLIQSVVKVGLIYYIWIDEQAGQLRFNFINSNHNTLPFTTQVKFIESEDEILSDYLNNKISTSGTFKIFKELITK